MASKFEERMRSKTAGFGARADADTAERSQNAAERPLQTMPAQLGAFRLEAQEYQRKIGERDKQIEALTNQLREAERKGISGIEIPIDKIHELEGRRRYMSPEDYRDLRENLRRNVLIQPIVVEVRLDGEYELVSGHHRTDAYRDLGRTTIRATLREKSNDDSTVAAFYANLFQSPLTDYEKFLGFTDLQKRFPSMTQAQIAETSGKTEAAISYLMDFADLPGEVKQLLDETPSLLGSNAARDFARLTRAGKGKQVAEAVRQLADGSIDQKQAVTIASVDLAKVRPNPVVTPEIVKIKAGREMYCNMRRTSKVVRLEFHSEAEAQDVQKAIQAVLEERAQASKEAAAEDVEK